MKLFAALRTFLLQEEATKTKLAKDLEKACAELHDTEGDGKFYPRGNRAQ